MSAPEQRLIATGAVGALEELRAGIESLHLLGLSDVVERIADLAARAELASVTELSLSGNSPDWRNRPPPVAALATLATAPALACVKTLTLERNVLDDQGAFALASAPWLVTVETLKISDNPGLGPAGLTALIAQLPAVKELFIEQCNVGIAGAQAIAASSMPLRDLALVDCSIREEGARALFGAAFVSNVTRICIARDFLKDALARLAIRPASALEQLELPRSSLSDAGTVDFARGLTHHALGDIDLANNLLGDDTALAFASSTGFPELERLDLRRNGITAKGAAALCNSTAMPKLALVGLTENELKTGNTSIHEWPGGMYEAGGMVVEEKLTAAQIERLYVKGSGLRVY